MGFLFSGNKKSESAPAPQPAPAAAPVSEKTETDPKKARRGASNTVLTGSNSLNSATTNKTVLG